jgi:aminodeoxyfutalosine deaminase
MRRFSAQYIITNSGPVLKRGVITTNDDGTILDITDTGGELSEKHSTEFYNGIIIPGFVNCHCHLELSHMKGCIPEGIGLGSFLEQIRNTRINDPEAISEAIRFGDDELAREGVVLCTDICNTTDTFPLKMKSRVSYLNLLEVFGIDPGKAKQRIDEILKVSEAAKSMDLPHTIVPHSAYSVSLPLFRLLKDIGSCNQVTSVHFMESIAELQFLESHSGPLYDSFSKSGLLPPSLELVKDHADAVINEITSSGNLILVHDTSVDQVTIEKVSSRGKLFWCLCPNSNLYIGGQIPPVDLMVRNKCEIVIGTDSLSSNHNLSIIEELKTIQSFFPHLLLEDLVFWATFNGARALGMEDQFGRLETGKKPGLLLINEADLTNMKFLPESHITRLI